MIVVLDTNIVASATYWGGKPGRCLEAWLLGRYALATSQPILAEYEEVILRLARRYPTKPATDWLSSIKQAAHLVSPSRIPGSCRDPDDEKFIECAVAAEANYLVTGDHAHLLRIEKVGAVSILTVSAFLEFIEAGPESGVEP